MWLVLLCLSFSHFLLRAESAKILFIPANGAPSHTKGMYPFAASLAQNGHEVIMLQFITADVLKTKAPSKSNVQDRYLMPPLKPGEKPEIGTVHPSILWGYIPLAGMTIFMPWQFFSGTCVKIMANDGLRREFRQILEEKRFDMVVVDDLFAPCGMVAAEKARRINPNATVIDFGTTVLSTRSQEVRGLPLSRSTYPALLKPTPDGTYTHQSFKHRMHNYLDQTGFDIVVGLLDYVVPHWLSMPPNEGTVPSMFSLESDLLIASLSPMLEFVKPRSNDVIELDVSCPPMAKLPEKYASFVDDPKSKGTILLAMGHMADWDEAPEAAYNAFFEAFARLAPEYRIVWQYMGKKPKPLQPPPGVLMDAWIPQAALLYHPKTKVFISHCGGKSLREAICGGIPMATMPMFAEQYRNAAIAHKKGIATFLDKTTLTPDIVYDALIKILNDNSYQKRAQQIQKQLADQPMEAMEVGRFWAEFLLRHGKSSIRKYFRMRYPKLPFLARGSLDMILASLVVLCGLVKIVC